MGTVPSQAIPKSKPVTFQGTTTAPKAAWKSKHEKGVEETIERAVLSSAKAVQAVFGFCATQDKISPAERRRVTDASLHTATGRR
jgi:hypothetical protein